METVMHLRTLSVPVVGLLLAVVPARAEKPSLSDYFPPPESKGGWRTLLPDRGEPSAEQKSIITKTAGVEWDSLKRAWDLNAETDGASGLVVIRKGHVVGEWYKDGGPERAFNIYSSSKAYTSVAYGLLLADSDAGKLPGGRKLTLDTKVCNADWLPESLPLSDPRKADISVRHLLNMASGVGGDTISTVAPIEYSLGTMHGSPFVKLKADPGTAFNYSNAGVTHLVLVFHQAIGRDLLPFLRERLFEPIGMENMAWLPVGVCGKRGILSQGYSGVVTTPRQHARFCYLALHKGEWAGNRVVPAEYYDFAWQGTKTKADYGAQWWVWPRHKDAPRDLVQTAGAINNHGYVVPSLDLVFVRLGDGTRFPKDFEGELVRRVIAAVR
jgi:CubicO group peptidase (beta-lactamase class C family)